MHWELSQGQGIHIKWKRHCLISTSLVLKTLPRQHQAHVPVGNREYLLLWQCSEPPQKSEVTAVKANRIFFAHRDMEEDRRCSRRLELTDSSWNSWLLLQHCYHWAKPAYVLSSEGPAREHYFHATGRVICQLQSLQSMGQEMFQCSNIPKPLDHGTVSNTC